MYAYARASTYMRSVARRVADVTKNAPLVLSEESCMEIMKSLARDTIEGRTYRWNRETCQVELDDADGGRTYRMPALIITKTAIFIHLDLVGHFDPVGDAIKFCHSAFLPRARTYIRSVPVSDNAPHMFQVRRMTPALGRQHRVIDHLKEVTESMLLAYPELAERADDSRPKVKSGAQQLTMHYDEMSRRTRAALLHYDDDDFAALNFDRYEQFARQATPHDDPLHGQRHRRYVLDMAQRYPFKR